MGADVTESAILGSLSNDDGDGNENDKKTIGLDKENNNVTRASRFEFLYISLPLLHDYNVKPSIFTFYGGRDHKKTIFFFFFSS